MMTVAACKVNPAQNGTAVGVTWANDNTGPFGTPAPFFDGANDYITVNTAALQAAWNAGGAEWTLFLWLKVANAGVWTDGQGRMAWNYEAAGNDRGSFQKSSVANRVIFTNVGGGTIESHNLNLISDTGWLVMAMTRSETADEVRYYWDATHRATDTSIGTWSAAGAWNTNTLGAVNPTPTFPWHGWLAHLAAFPYALSAPQITDLANP